MRTGWCDVPQGAWVAGCEVPKGLEQSIKDLEEKLDAKIYHGLEERNRNMGDRISALEDAITNKSESGVGTGDLPASVIKVVIDKLVNGDNITSFVKACMREVPQERLLSREGSDDNLQDETQGKSSNPRKTRQAFRETREIQETTVD
jgi:hypothetical protein